MAQPLYMLAFAPTVLMLWACAVRMSRTAELRGRLFGRSTTQLFAGGMMILGAMLAMAMCWMLDIPLEKSPSTAPRDVVKFGLLFFAAGLIVALGATAGIHLVPQRSRRSGPNRRANSVLFGFTYYVSKVTRLVLLAFLAFIFLVVLVEGPRSFRRGDWPMFPRLPCRRPSSPDVGDDPLRRQGAAHDVVLREAAAFGATELNRRPATRSLPPTVHRGASSVCGIANVRGVLRRRDRRASGAARCTR